MATKSRRKGNYHEKKIEKTLSEMGLKVKRQPLSGSLGGEYTGDLLLEIEGQRLVVEVKYRNGNSFPSAFTTFKDRDVVIYKRRTGTPQTIIMFTEEIFEKHIAPKLK
tara:strand:+ start:4932 stop:5255 length:324 start_codon:yes stop_codon:yes gene_type:complete